LDILELDIGHEGRPIPSLPLACGCRGEPATGVKYDSVFIYIVYSIYASLSLSSFFHSFPFI
jgi:hypothetical protein